MAEFNRPKWDRGEGYEQLPGFSIPWEMMLPHEKQSQVNHCQSLKRISERGGFGRCEAIAVLEDRKWTPMSPEDSDKKLKQMVADWIKQHES
jgi:hypothetical protein